MGVSGARTSLRLSFPWSAKAPSPAPKQVRQSPDPGTQAGSLRPRPLPARAGASPGAHGAAGGSARPSPASPQCSLAPCPVSVCQAPPHPAVGQSGQLTRPDPAPLREPVSKGPPPSSEPAPPFQAPPHP